MVTLCLSNGVPMITAGDERGRTQGGNNNPYVQDNEISWVDWRPDDAWLDVYEVTKAALRLRREHPALRQRHWFEGRPTIEGGPKDLVWLHPSGREMAGDDWADDALTRRRHARHRRPAALPRPARGAAVGQLVPDLAERRGRAGRGHDARGRLGVPGEVVVSTCPDHPVGTTVEAGEVLTARRPHGRGSQAGLSRWPCNVSRVRGVLGRVRVSETQEYAELVAARAPALLRLAVMLTGNRAEAEDLLQATLVRTQAHAHRIPAMGAPGGVPPPKALVHEHLSGLRRLGRRVRTSPLDDHDVASPDDVAGLDRRDAAWRLLAKLPPRQRAVLVLRFYEDLPDRDIAAVLGCSEPTVRSNASRGLATLRSRLSDTEEALP